MYDVVNDLIGAKDLLEARSQLQKIDNIIARKNINRSAYCKKLSQAILQAVGAQKIGYILAGEKPKYHIHSVNSSIPAYLASHGLTVGGVVEMRKRIRKLIAEIGETIIEPSGIKLSVEGEQKILDMLINKFPFWEAMPGIESLDILNINNTHREFNSIFGVDAEATSFVIYMLNMNDPTVAPEYVFLHELGHVVQTVLTGSCRLIPDEFLEFNASLDVMLEQGNPDLPEIFADTFAIAAMRGTELNDCISQLFPHDDLSEKFENFHIKLLGEKKLKPASSV